jgi:hypothetical protein
MKKNITIPDQLQLFDIEPVQHISKSNEKKAADEYSFNLMDALRSPVITASPMWADTIPARLLRELPLARMKALKKGEQMATYLECSIYLYTASLEAPMTHDWTTITCHVSCKVLEDLFNEDHWQELRATKVLNDYLMSELNKLRHSIYSKRRDLLKKR